MGTEEYIAPEVVNGEGQSSAVDWWTLGILIYEMLTGTTPFKGSYTDETFNNIVHEQLKWPDDIYVSGECKQLVKKLLRREADKRLGAENGASDIKRSKWFKDFNFALIRVSLLDHFPIFSLSLSPSPSPSLYLSSVLTVTVVFFSILFIYVAAM